MDARNLFVARWALPVMVAAVAMLLASSQPAHAYSWLEKAICRFMNPTQPCDGGQRWIEAPRAAPDTTAVPVPPPTSVKAVPKWLSARIG